MFDNFLIRKDSLKNDVDKSGHIIGFQLAARNANYRSVYLSLHNGYYAGPIQVLKKHGYDGYINSEYEGQRRFQDRGVEDLIDETDQVRKHQAMLKRFIENE